MKPARTPRLKRNRVPIEESVTPRAPALSDDLATSILLQIKDAMPRIETELKHVRRLAEATRKDVEDLKTWRTLVLGGAAALGILFGLYKATAGSVHVTFGNPTPTATLSSTPGN